MPGWHGWIACSNLQRVRAADCISWGQAHVPMMLAARRVTARGSAAGCVVGPVLLSLGQGCGTGVAAVIIAILPGRSALGIPIQSGVTNALRETAARLGCCGDTPEHADLAAIIRHVQMHRHAALSGAVQCGREAWRAGDGGPVFLTFSATSCIGDSALIKPMVRFAGRNGCSTQTPASPMLTSATCCRRPAIAGHEGRILGCRPGSSSVPPVNYADGMALVAGSEEQIEVQTAACMHWCTLLGRGGGGAKLPLCAKRG